MVESGWCTNDDNFRRCSYTSVNFGDDNECRRCTRYRKKCTSICKGRLTRITILTAKVVIVINLLLFVVFPLIFKFCYPIQRRAVFLHFGSITLKVAALMNSNLPKNNDYSDPKLFGLEKARNFYANHNGVKLGVWQILPSNLMLNESDEKSFETFLGNGQDVILYNHGNAGSRATAHRVEMYKILSNFFHVITYDYRGYGDSSDDPPTEEDVVSDSIFMVQWIRSKIAPGSNIFIWGHSLGTSITLSTVSAMKRKGFIPTGVMLEAPFNNLRDEIGEFPLSMLFRYLPWFETCFVDPLTDNGFAFQSDRYISNVDCPILIMHAEDDKTVPFRLGKKLYDGAMGNRSDDQGSVKFVSFAKKHHYGHRYIIRAPELHDIIEKFVKSAINETSTLNTEKKD